MQQFWEEDGKDVVAKVKKKATKPDKAAKDKGSAWDSVAKSRTRKTSAYGRDLPEPNTKKPTKALAR
jgi:hypothetical protein